VDSGYSLVGTILVCSFGGWWLLLLFGDTVAFDFQMMTVQQQQQQASRLPTLREVDCQQELVNMAAAMLSAAAANSVQNNREMQAHQLQHQLQQQQQQYAILLAQAVQQQQQQVNFQQLPQLLGASPLSPTAAMMNEKAVGGRTQPTFGSLPEPLLEHLHFWAFQLFDQLPTFADQQQPEEFTGMHLG